MVAQKRIISRGSPCCPPDVMHFPIWADTPQGAFRVVHGAEIAEHVPKTALDDGYSGKEQKSDDSFLSFCLSAVVEYNPGEGPLAQGIIDDARRFLCFLCFLCF